MNKEKLLAMLKDKKIQNYSYHIFFFITFSFFIIFAIQPNLSTAFHLQKELQDLRLKNKQFEEVILQIVNYQSLMEEYRDSLSVLDEAIPSSPELTEIIEDISKIASDSGLIVKSLTIESIALKEDHKKDQSSSGGDSIDEVQGVESDTNEDTSLNKLVEVEGNKEETTGLSKQPKLLSFTITVTGDATFPQISQFLNQIIDQRRLKTYDSISFSSDDSNTNTVISILIRTYYL